MAITIREIAEKANVSTATVSMVLNSKPGISEQTRRRVFDIVESFGYNVSPLKSSMLKHNGTLQLTIYRKHSQVVADTAFFEALIAGIENTARQSGYQLIVKSVTGDKLTADLVIPDHNGNSIDGILLLGTEMDEQDMLSAMDIQYPLLILDTRFLGVRSNFVVIDNVCGVYIGVKHLIEIGHREIGYLKSSIAIENFDERFEGYLKAMDSCGLDVDELYTIPLRPTIDGAYEDMSYYMSFNPKIPTAFFADNDIIACGAMKALKEAGVKIPEDVSIIGFDDMPLCTIIEPALSTIAVNKKMLGTLAVEKLIGLISAKEENHSTTLLGVDLIIRESIKPPK